MQSNQASPDSFTLHKAVLARTLHQFTCPLPHLINRMILSALTLLWLATSLCAQTPAPMTTRMLPTGDPLELNIGGSEKHLYEVALNSDEFFQILVAQIDVDVLLRLLDTSGLEVARMSIPRNYQSGQTLTFVSPVHGSYRLEVTALAAKAAPGKYAIRRQPSRTATAQDRRRVEVERIFVEGMTARGTAGGTVTATQKFTEALAGWRELADGHMFDITNLLLVQSKARTAFIEARALLEKNTGESNPQALIKFEEASKLYHEGGEIKKEGAALIGAALAATTLKKPSIAIDFLKKAFPLYSKPEERSIKADLLLEIVKLSISLEDDNTALEHLLLALPVYTELGLQREKAITAMTIGAYYYKVGNNDKAFEFLTGALPFRNILGDKCYEVELLINLGAVTLALDRKAEAVKLLNEEIPVLLKSESGCEAQKAVAFNNLGKAYYNLSDFGLAIDNYKEALRFSKDTNIKADTYLNLGAAYFASSRYKESLASYKVAKSLYEEVSAQNTVDLLNLEISQDQSPLEKLKSSLKLKQNIGDKNGEARTLASLSEVYLKLGDIQAALASSDQSLRLYSALTDRSGEAIALGNAMKVWNSAGNRRLAIFFGKQSVNKIQDLRGAARGIEIGVQKTYLRTFKNSYQQLAELLIAEGLFEQAVQVLNLYRDQQFFDFDLNPNTPVERVHLSTREDNFAQRYETESRKLRNLGAQIAELKRQSGNRQSGVAEAGNLLKFEAEFKTAQQAFAAVLKDAANELRKPSGDGDKDRYVKDVIKLRESLGKLRAAPRQKAVSLYPFAGNERFYILLLTPDGVKAFSHPTKASVINDEVKDFLAVLSCPDFDPFQKAAALYNIMFKSVSVEDKQTTLEAELEKRNPDLLIWSLDDPLDSVPMAALYDGTHKQFLVEKYQHAIFTRAVPDRISREPKSWLNGIGLGTSKEYTGYPPLPGVKKSLSIIFDDEVTGRKGIIHGPALIDEQFKRAVLENLSGKWPLVHIASHFDYRPGYADKSVLLLGDGNVFSLAEMQRHKTLFANVELLMLSACKTSVQTSNAYGKEIDGFAELAQRLGASSVIAALWNVDDLATPGREIAFYRLYRDHQDWAKSEVLRQSQLNLLKGKVTLEPGEPFGRLAASVKDEGREGCAAHDKPHKRFTPDPNAPLAHPYYWAPFVLYGGSR
jgi:CHAT domain-containing protein